jgi:GT2 family glycosyltransferase
MFEKPVRVVCATRVPKVEFSSKTALGRSLAISQYRDSCQLQLFAENETGLAEVYNRAIDHAKSNPAFLVFIHDDVHLCDLFWMDAIRTGLRRFDVVGVAGNIRRVPKQPAWAFIDENFVWDRSEFLSGVVGHGKGYPCDIVSVFGKSGQECKLLDGVLLAADSERLHEVDLKFDSRFAFHFYDVDFCRQSEEKKLTMGTWPISIVHESGGAFGSAAWRAAYHQYLQKYRESSEFYRLS